MYIHVKLYVYIKIENSLQSSDLDEDIVVKDSKIEKDQVNKERNKRSKVLIIYS